MNPAILFSSFFRRRSLIIIFGQQQTIGKRRNMSVSTSAFKDKVVLVTGSSSGIGEEIAVYLSSLGASVTITGRNQERLKKVRERCTSIDGNAKILDLIADVGKDQDLKMLVDRTVERFGSIDVLVNNAGIYQMCPIADENCIPLYDNLFHINVRSVVYLTRLAIPHLAKTKGNIVNISSVASHKPAALNTLYAMTKSAIDMFTKSLALELGPKGIRVNAINPAAIRTPIFNKVKNSDLSTDRMTEIAAKSYPVGRIGEPIDCAKAVAYLASNADASFINGVTLLVDGGSVYTSLIMPDSK